MSVDQHRQNRDWTFRALLELKTFLTDPDFEGDRGEEQTGIDRKYNELRDGKYRVVFLGAFNSGKSTLINAFLGNEYLPTVLEECTTKIIHIVKAETLRTTLRLSAAASEAELEALRTVLTASGVDAALSSDIDNAELTIAYRGQTPRSVLNSLTALTTINADEDFPQLRSLRQKFDEVVVHLPNDQLQEDIALLDSPGVHSISQINQKIVQEIIPHCHLVICLLDSQNAGNEHNRDFIEQLVKQRHRKVFFVINKVDHLNPEEIDPLGRRGPAKDLLRSLQGIVDKPELFFLSSLYAVVASQLAQKKMSLTDLDKNNKIKIPFGVQQLLLKDLDPVKGAAEYLLDRSNFTAFRERLLDYLYTENREGAIVDSVCRFVDATAWKYARPLETQIELARNLPRLEELRREREQLSQTLERNTAQATHILDEFSAMSGGGEVDGTPYAGYEGLVEEQFSSTAIDEQIGNPIKNWIGNDQNLRNAKKNGFQPLTKELEQLLDSFLYRVHGSIMQEVDAIEARARQRVEPLLGAALGLDKEHVDAPRANILTVHTGMGASYLAFGAIGLALGAGLGAGLATLFLTTAHLATLFGPDLLQVPHSNLIAGALAGATLGLLAGVFARSVGSDDTRKDNLNKRIAAKVEQVLQRETKKQLKTGLDKRRTAFATAIRTAFDEADAALNRQLSDIVAEEEQIKGQQQEKIARLEPKVEKLAALGRAAREITTQSAPNVSF